MSSGQWEVVGKSKKSQNGKVKNPKDDEKKPTKNGTKVEDIVPHSQIKSYYAGMEIDDTSKPPKEQKKGGEKKNKKQDKKSEPAKPKPTTIEHAVYEIDLTELASIITTNKVRFSNAPLIWLKEVANFLNSKIQIEIDDPTFSDYNPNYPLCGIPDDVKSILQKLLEDAGWQDAQLFFDITLTALANDMSRGQPAHGHRLLLQMMAKENPDFCMAAIQKIISLRNSYQNRPPICLSLLWALGQGGIKSFLVGFKVWNDAFLPLLEQKNYSKYVITYLSTLLNLHEDTKVTQEQYLAMLDLVNNKKNSLPKDLSSKLTSQLFKFKEMYFKNSGNKLQVAFNQLMKKLPNQYLSGSNVDPYNEVILDSLIECLTLDDSCNMTWRQLFHKCSKQSATLIEHINENWDIACPRLNMKSLKVTLTQYMEVCGDNLKGKKKDETVVKTKKICQGLLDNMTTSPRKFPWLWASFFLLIGIAGLISYDVSRVNGNFPKSATGKLLNDLGILEQSQHAWRKTLSTSARGYLWLETNVPIYYATTVDTCAPYAQLSKELAIVAGKKMGAFYGNMKNYVVEKTPVVVATIDQYAPGVVDTVESYVVSGYTTIRKYSNDYYQVTLEFFKTKVFVGEWAPEILQNKTQLALNATRTHMSSYFHWFRKQVDLYSEIP